MGEEGGGGDDDGAGDDVLWDATASVPNSTLPVVLSSVGAGPPILPGLAVRHCPPQHTPVLRLIPLLTGPPPSPSSRRPSARSVPVGARFDAAEETEDGASGGVLGGDGRGRGAFEGGGRESGGVA